MKQLIVGLSFTVSNLDIYNVNEMFAHAVAMASLTGDSGSKQPVAKDLLKMTNTIWIIHILQPCTHQPTYVTLDYREDEHSH